MQEENTQRSMLVFAYLVFGRSNLFSLIWSSVIKIYLFDSNSTAQIINNITIIVVYCHKIGEIGHISRFVFTCTKMSTLKITGSKYQYLNQYFKSF